MDGEELMEVMRPFTSKEESILGEETMEGEELIRPFTSKALRKVHIRVQWCNNHGCNI